jgi:NUMOD3 motif-containing protein
MVKEKNYFGLIYVLLDPCFEGWKIRYIGQTIQSLSERLRGHIKARNRKKTHVSCWIKSLMDQNLEPKILPLDVAYTREELDAMEIFYIKYAREMGEDLTNHTDGGRGIKGFRHSPEEIIKQSKREKGKKLSEAHKQKIANAHKGKIVSQETKDKLSKVNMGHKHSEETRLKLLGLHKGEKSGRYRRDISRELVTQMFNVGLSKKKISEELKCSLGLIYKILKNQR